MKFPLICVFLRICIWYFRKHIYSFRITWRNKKVGFMSTSYVTHFLTKCFYYEHFERNKNIWKKVHENNPRKKASCFFPDSCNKIIYKGHLIEAKRQFCLLMVVRISLTPINGTCPTPLMCVCPCFVNNPPLYWIRLLECVHVGSVRMFAGEDGVVGRVWESNLWCWEGERC